MLIYPKPMTQAQRFDQLPSASAPISARLNIYWEEHAIPFIEADNNSDLAFGLGLVNAHLRLGQLELFRMISQGRLGEITGPVPQVDTVDHGLRMLDLCTAGKKAYDAMALESQLWLDRFREGINWYIGQIKEPPVEFGLLGFKPRPFSDRDIQCISRLVAADLTWLFYLKFLQLAEQPNWQEALSHTLKERLQDTATFSDPESPLLSKVITSLSKSGSNSLVISKSKSSTSGALIANDPHVGLLLPNFWMLVGLKSPDIHAFGLMIPGVPVIGVGRNPHIAWGGTNMRGISSHLIDVSGLPENQIKTRKEVLKRRWWFDKEVEVRVSPYGPILTDLPLFDQKTQPFTAALDWVGQRGSDELGAFLSVSKARNWNEFRESFRNYYVSAFNMLYADSQGNIGMIPAYGQPRLMQPEDTLSFIKPISNVIEEIISPIDQPNPFNPKSGYISSANNKPFANP
ncbi:MAG: penicillin acylase family protein, partial [Pseudomonadales bacterium]|nr:penicillin acylase family protein [Pseudomonadales bacterium]